MRFGFGLKKKREEDEDSDEGLTTNAFEHLCYEVTKRVENNQEQEMENLVKNFNKVKP